MHPLCLPDQTEFVLLPAGVSGGHCGGNHSGRTRTSGVPLHGGAGLPQLRARALLLPFAPAHHLRGRLLTGEARLLRELLVHRPVRRVRHDHLHLHDRLPGLRSGSDRIGGDRYLLPHGGAVFGALISAVDPVATLSIMGNPELNCDPLLYALVFGESVLNDAVAIVLFKSFMSFYESEQEFSSKTIPIIMTSFTIVSLSSVAVGILTGLLCSYLCKHTQMRLYPEYEISMLFLFAYGSYSFSEALGLSGIMSLFFCGIVLSHYNSHNLSPTSQITAHNIFKSLAVLSEYFVFLYIGMGLFTGKYREIHVPFFILCTLFCLFARLFNIIPLSWLANLGRKVPIPTKMQVVMWFAGLRGAIAFALSQNMPSEHKDVYISTTLGIVITTTLVCGGLTEPILSKMGMRVIGERAAGASPGADTHVRAEHGDVDHGDLPPLSMGEVMTEVSAEVSAQRSRASNAFFNFIGGDSNEGGAARVERRYEAYEHLALQDDGSPMQSSSAPGLAGSDVDSAEGREGSLRPRSLMERFDRDYMQPLFGGPQLGVTPSRPDNAGHIELTSGSLVRGGSRGESGSGSDRGESKSGTRNSNKGNTSSGVSRDGGAEQRHLSAQPLPA
mmetsp:Transcript_15735/g.34794  ORF Transcript_15735/g.34794 Transcript_15735/m.34794 type:complete len:614 (+) Transcript_15735:141-1982(+)